MKTALILLFALLFCTSFAIATQVSTRYNITETIPNGQSVVVLTQCPENMVTYTGGCQGNSIAPTGVTVTTFPTVSAAVSGRNCTITFTSNANFQYINGWAVAVIAYCR